MTGYFILSVLLAAAVYLLFRVYTKTIRKNTEERDQFKIVGALSSDYSDVFLIEPAHGFSSSIKVHGKMISAGKRIKRNYSEIWSRYISEHVYSEDTEFVRERIASENIFRYFEGADEFSFDYRIFYNNEIHYMQVKFVKLFGESDKIIAGFRNTDKQVEAEKKRSETLQNALDSARKASAAKTEFLTNMSHDIRTPMNAIIGFTSLALMHPGEPEVVREYLSKILVSGEHLMNLINDVLDMSRIESGQVRIEHTTVFLPDVIKEVETIANATNSSVKIKFSVKCDEIKDNYVYCDKLHLYQILINILSNAFKYTEPGGEVSLYVTQNECDDSRNGEYVFRIKDNGIGMSSEFREHIFESFSRERTSTVSGIQGTGLGMAITRNLVEMMGGTISLSSEKDVGTEFIVVFRFRIMNGMSSKEKDNNEDEFYENDRIKEKFKGRKVLIAEDNEMNQEIIEEVLKEAGFVTDIASDGTEAVEKIRNSVPGQYDLILMDIQMPQMNGYEATRIIRSLPEEYKSGIPVIAMTANAFDEDRRKAFEAGMNAHMLKPIKISEFLRTISRFVLKNED